MDFDELAVTYRWRPSQREVEDLLEDRKAELDMLSKLPSKVMVDVAEQVEMQLELLVALREEIINH